MIKPYKDQPGSRKEQVRTMFNRIAGRYDFLNHFLSFNNDKLWRRKLVSMVRNDMKSYRISENELRFLDIATGTGDLAFALVDLSPAKITGIDIAEEMLDVARNKAQKRGLEIDFVQADSEALPFGEDNFDLVTVAFGIRNFENLQQGLREMHRVLQPGGRLFILEFSVPPSFLYRKVYNFYSGKILPFMASFFTADKDAYRYLPSSIAVFPHGEEMMNILEACGFRDIGCKRLSGGIASIYYGKSGC